MEKGTPTSTEESEGVEDSLLSTSIFDYQGCSLVAQEAESNEKEKDKNIKKERDTCAICLEEVEESKRGVMDGCAHTFCFDCILEWSKITNTCPLCKQKFMSLTQVRAFVALKQKTGCPLFNRSNLVGKQINSQDSQETPTVLSVEERSQEVDYSVQVRLLDTIFYLHFSYLQFTPRNYNESWGTPSKRTNMATT